MLTSFGRKLKKINIILSFSVFILAIVFCIFYFTENPEPEGEIKALETKSLAIKLRKDDKQWEAPFVYDFSVSIENANDEFIAKNIDYLLEIKNEKGEVLSNSEKTISAIEVKSNADIKEEITMSEKGGSVVFKIKEAKWGKYDVLEKEE